MVVKATLPRWFSLGTFAAAQVAIDLEPGWNLFRGSWPVHAPLHTVVRSVLVAAELGPVPWLAALVGALVGGVSHVLLDAVIHPDVRPWAPWANANGLFAPRLFGLMHLLCAAAVVGMLLWLDKTRDESPYRIPPIQIDDQRTRSGRSHAPAWETPAGPDDAFDPASPPPPPDP